MCLYWRDIYDTGTFILLFSLRNFKLIYFNTSKLISPTCHGFLARFVTTDLNVTLPRNLIYNYLDFTLTGSVFFLKQKQLLPENDNYKNNIFPCSVANRVSDQRRNPKLKADI
jgi:hypothetical protein